jgi:hypothetical protein
MSTELKTSMTEGKRAAGAFFVALILFGMAALFYFGGDEGPGPDKFQAVAVLPGLLGALLLYSSIHALFGTRNPQVTITIGDNPVPRGRPVEVQVHQPGPVKLSSLRVNVVSEEVTIYYPRPSKRRRLSKFPYQENHLDFGPAEIPRGETRTFSGTITIPPHVEVRSEEPNRTVSWRLEVWGKVEGGADFIHRFEVELV